MTLTVTKIEGVQHTVRGVLGGEGEAALCSAAGEALKRGKVVGRVGRVQDRDEGVSAARVRKFEISPRFFSANGLFPHSINMRPFLSGNSGCRIRKIVNRNKIKGGRESFFVYKLRSYVSTSHNLILL